MVYLPHWPKPYDSRSLEEGPNRVKQILNNLDNPQNKIPPAIHITGTNGKGSTSSFCANILKENGYKTHIYTSPHIHHTNERIQLNNKIIDDDFLYQILEQVRIASININPSFFEAITCAAFLAFSQVKADFCIIEVGMGARIDATNIINNKIATIITSISDDHGEFLGENLTQIAFEKSFIMQQNAPCISDSQDKNATQILKLRAKEVKTTIKFLSEDFSFKINPDNSFDFISTAKTIRNIPKPNLIGRHQYHNATLAIKAILEADIPIKDNFLKQAMKSISIHSRLQEVSNNLNKLLLNQNIKLYIDGAHNKGGSIIIANWLKNQKYDKKYLICGFSKNKCQPDFFKPFKGIINFTA